MRGIFNNQQLFWLICRFWRSKSKQRELMSAVNNASAFVGSSLTGTIRNPQNTVQSGRYVVGLLQSFSPN
jgi:hypothetical protein